MLKNGEFQLDDGVSFFRSLPIMKPVYVPVIGMRSFELRNFFDQACNASSRATAAVVAEKHEDDLSSQPKIRQSHLGAVGIH